MDKFRNYEVVFSGLKNGKHKFQFEIDQSFFELHEAEQEFTNPRLVAEILLEKHTTFLEFWIEVHGNVALECDITGEIFDYEINPELKLLVNFGETYDDSNEEVITIPSTDHAFNMAQILYEMVVLAIPMKKIAPSIAKEDWELVERYALFSEKEAKESEQKFADENEQQEVDPRWEALKKLKDKN